VVCLADGNEWKMVLHTRYGLFEWLVIPEGLTNMPSTFQRFMNDIFSDMLDVSVIVYLDNILIYSNGDLFQHHMYVREVLHHLRKHKLFVKAEKCAFHANTVEYLGYILTPDSLTMDPTKVVTITTWPVPQKVKDLQSRHDTGTGKPVIMWSWVCSGTGTGLDFGTRGNTIPLSTGLRVPTAGHVPII
jgi:hypothetical protein